MARTVYITPDDHPSERINTCTLSYCIRYENYYLASNTQLLLQPGIHELQQDFVLQNVTDVVLKGNSSIIKCVNLTIGIVIMNAENIVIQNLEITDCGKNYSIALPFSPFSFTPALHWNAAVHLHFCAVAENISIFVTEGVNGLAVVNAIETELVDVQVTVQASASSNFTTNGMVVCYYAQSTASKFYVKNFVYKQESCYSNRIQNVFSIIFVHNILDIYVTISNTILRDLQNACILDYITDFNDRLIQVNFTNCYIYNNTFTEPSAVFFTALAEETESSLIILYKCQVYKNFNLSSIATIQNDYGNNAFFEVIIDACVIDHNHVLNIIRDIYNIYVLWERPITLYIIDTIISFNTHTSGDSLISISAGEIHFTNTTITNNIYYECIVEVKLAYIAVTEQVLNISKNHIRFVIIISETSYILLFSNSTVIVANNIVYSVLTKVMTFSPQTKSLCYFQFMIHPDSIYMVLNIKIVDNLYTAPKDLIEHESYFTNCEWILDVRFYAPGTVFNLHINNSKIDNKDIGIIPSSICKCTNSEAYKCSSHNLGHIIPGKLLTVDLIVPRLLLSKQSVTLYLFRLHIFHLVPGLVQLLELAR